MPEENQQIACAVCDKQFSPYETRKEFKTNLDDDSLHNPAFANCSTECDMCGINHHHVKATGIRYCDMFRCDTMTYQTHMNMHCRMCRVLSDTLDSKLTCKNCIEKLEQRQVNTHKARHTSLHTICEFCHNEICEPRCKRRFCKKCNSCIASRHNHCDHCNKCQITHTNSKGVFCNGCGNPITIDKMIPNLREREVATIENSSQSRKLGALFLKALGVVIIISLSLFLIQ